MGERSHRIWVGVCVVAIAGCGSSQGTQPHDMSTRGHEEAASEEDRRADTHQAQDDALASGATRCGSPRQDSDGACWTSDVSPTEAQTAEVARHRQLAAEHRAAAQSLRDAEVRACGGIDEMDRDTSPFEHFEDVESVSVLTESVRQGRQDVPRTAGATVVFAAVPGMTAEWLQRLLDCHLARNASVGHDMPEMPSCPLVPRGATARVRSTGTGFAVDVRSDDAETAAEILRRARLLVPPT